MAFPNDLTDVVVFKIHPAIGVARVSLNDDHYVFGRDPGTYKSQGLMKRQAVQFRIFAYGANHVGLGELTADVMNDLNIAAVWSARVANRKIARLENTPLGGSAFVISAEASSDDANRGELIGSLPQFEEGTAIPMGQITSTGLFIPPKGGVFRKTAGIPVPGYPGNNLVADTACDGSITVRLTVGAQELPALPACIVVAPQDFSPDVDPTENLTDYLRSRLHLPPPVAGNLHNQAARTIDESALRSATADFLPGFEVSFGQFDTEVVDYDSIFYKTSQDPRIDPSEIRPRYKPSPGDPGAVPGQLTSGLCSPWQADFTACVGYWTENLPPRGFLDENSSIGVSVFRKTYTDQSPSAPRLTSGDDFADSVDKVGVMRMMNSKLTETERNPGDDI
jgi:hypothetical protein